MILLGEVAHPLPVPHPTGKPWTIADYRAMPEGGPRHELINGILYMTPAPRLPHQTTLGLIHHWFLLRYPPGQSGPRVVFAPFDVYLADDVVVQPDLLVVLPDRRHLLADDGFHGAPSLVLEVSSPGTTTYDRHEKLLAYARAGVPEYWLVDPLGKTLEILRLHDGRYRNHALVTGPADVPSLALGTQPGPVAAFFPA
jgi:Uma2 family endonuclease